MNRPLKETHRRHLEIAGAYNVRDLGGYHTNAGQLTRWGRFLRGDLLADIPIESQRALASYGIRTAIDLRTESELLQKPSVLAHSSEIEYFHHNLMGNGEPPGGPYDWASPEGIADGYTRILEARKAQVKDTLSTLAIPQALPAVFFCAGGTDRTGIIAALLLGMAGVPDETIARDYRLSAQALVERFLKEGRPEWMPAEDLVSGRALETLARTETMHHALRYLQDVYGGVAEYVHSIGLTDSQIRILREALVA